MEINKVLASVGQPKRKSRQNLGGSIKTSIDFGYNKVLFSSLMMPGDKFKLRYSQFLQMSPMVAPVLGNCSLKISSYFVPNRLACPYFEDWYNQQNTYVNGTAQTASIPKFNNFNMVQWFTQHCAFKVNYVRKMPSSVPSDEQSPWEPIQGNGYYFWPTCLQPTAVLSAYRSEPLVEIVGICGGVDVENNCPTEVYHAVTSYNSTDGFSLHFEQKDSDVDFLYRGTDYDFVALCSDDSRYWLYMPWQAKEVKKADGTWTDSFNSRYVLFKFTRLGKRVYDALLSLGYSFNFSIPSFTLSYTGMPSVTNHNLVNLTTFGTVAQNDTAYYDAILTNSVVKMRVKATTSNDLTDMNFFAINSFLKIIEDYLVPTQYYKTYYDIIEKFISRSSNNGYSDFNVLRLFGIGSYDRDYFTSAWQSPTHASSADGTLTTVGLSTTLLTNGAPGNENVSDDSSSVNLNLANSSKINALSIRALHAVDKLVRLRSLSGSRFVDRVYALFGVRPDDARSRRAEKLKSFEADFDLQKIISSADTSGASLGDICCDGTSSCDDVDLGAVEVSEWGHLVIIMNVTPKPVYYQGRLRTNLYTDRRQFFDAILDETDSMQSIRQDELYTGLSLPSLYMLSANRSLYKADGTFGYTRLFAEMKKGHDLLTGDFRLPSRGKYSMNCYHLFRELPTPFQASLNGFTFTAGQNFVECRDSAQYDRIFQSTDTDYDHFFVFGNLRILGTRQCKPINDFTYEDCSDKETRSLNNMGTQE